MINLDLNIVSTLILAIVLCLFGNFIKNKFSIFNKVCIPTPVIGGLFFFFINFYSQKVWRFRNNYGYIFNALFSIDILYKRWILHKYF